MIDPVRERVCQPIDFSLQKRDVKFGDERGTHKSDSGDESTRSVYTSAMKGAAILSGME